MHTSVSHHWQASYLLPQKLALSQQELGANKQTPSLRSVHFSFTSHNHLFFFYIQYIIIYHELLCGVTVMVNLW